MHTLYESASVLEKRRHVANIESKEAVASSLFRNRRWKRVSLTAVAGVGGGERERGQQHRGSQALYTAPTQWCTQGEGGSGCLSTPISLLLNAASGLRNSVSRTVTVTRPRSPRVKFALRGSWQGSISQDLLQLLPRLRQKRSHIV